MYVDIDGDIHHLHHPQDMNTWSTYGAPHTAFHQAYLNTAQRRADVELLGKPADESDTSDDSDAELQMTSAAAEQQPTSAAAEQPPTPAATNEESSNATAVTPAYKQGLSRQEIKAIDREIPWRSILQMPQNYLDKFIASVDKEANSCSEWQSIEPLIDQQADEVLKDPKLVKRVIPSRACYRDKACGVGELQAK